jgi:hypothetical protein
MALFNGGAVPLHRQLKGLLLPGLPRGRIAARAVRGLPLPLAALP